MDNEFTNGIDPRGASCGSPADDDAFERDVLNYQPSARIDRKESPSCEDASAPAAEETPGDSGTADAETGPAQPAPKKRLPPAAAFALDALLIGCGLLVFALFHHVLPSVNPQGDTPVQLVSLSDITPPAQEVTAADTAVSDSDAQPEEEAEDLPFTDEVIVTDTSYTSPNVAVTVTTGKYGKATYHIQDIYVRDISCLRTAFAKDTYGAWITDTTPNIAAANNAVCAINGDFYGASSTKGIVIRNGSFYRGNGSDKDDILVMYADGSMEVIPVSAYNEKTLLEKDVWQAWSFGPSMLTADGSAIAEFDSEIAYANPRTVIGYYEPGHYCFITIDGRTKESKGMTFATLSKFCNSLGLTAAYNLDGGKTSMMTFGGKVINDAYQGGRKCSDIICVCDPSADGQ